MSATHLTNEGLEQIRQIVVGDFERDVERRLARIEGSLAEVPQEARRRMEVIEAHLRKETEALAGRVEAETVDTREALRGTSREQREAVHALEQRMTKLEDMIAKHQQALRQEILDQAKLFLDELHGLRAELTEIVDRELGTIDSDGEEPVRRERRSDLTESPAT